MSVADLIALDLREETWSQGCTPDREKHLIPGVKICGLEAQDKRRRYKPEALRSAISMYEGCEVNVDHSLDPTESRGIAEGWGWLRNVCYKETPSPGLWGDLEYLQEHAATPLILERAERQKGKGLGLSHNATGMKRDGDDGWHIVEEITRVRSVDLVRNPATTAGLTEEITEPKEEPMAKPSTKPRREFLAPLLAKSRPARQLLDLVEMDEMGLDPNLPVDTVAEADPAEQVQMAFDSAVLEVIHMDIETSEKVNRIRAILRAQEGAAEAVSGEPADDTLPADDEAQESKDEAAALKVQISARDLLDKKGFTLSQLSESRQKLLKEAGTAELAESLIESFELKPPAPGTKPKITRATSTETSSYEDLKKSTRARQARSRVK